MPQTMLRAFGLLVAVLTLSTVHPTTLAQPTIPPAKQRTQDAKPKKPPVPQAAITAPVAREVPDSELPYRLLTEFNLTCKTEDLWRSVYFDNNGRPSLMVEKLECARVLSESTASKYGQVALTKSMIVDNNIETAKYGRPPGELT